MVNRRQRTAAAIIAIMVAFAATVGSGAAQAASANTDTVRALPSHPVLALNVLTASRHPGQAVSFNFGGSSLTNKLSSVRVTFGDGKKTKRRSLTRAFSHTYKRAGVYRVSARLTQKNGAAATASRAVVVSPRNMAALRRTTQRYHAAVLTAFTPLSVSSERIIVSGRASAPRVGHTLMFPDSSLVPRGLNIVVESVHRNAARDYVVTGHDAKLGQIYRAFNNANTAAIGSRVQLTRQLPNGRVEYRNLSAKHVPFECSSGASASVTLSADLSNTHIDSVINAQAKTFSLSVISKPVFSLTAALNGRVSCSVSGGWGLNIPIAATGLVVTVTPYFDFNASTTLSATASWSPQMFVDVVRSPKYNSSWAQFVDKAGASAQGNATADLDGGLVIRISVARAVGVEAKVGPELHLKATASTNQACVDVTSDLHLEITLFLDVLFAHNDLTLYQGDYYPKNLFHTCASSGSPTGSGSGSSGGSGGTTTGGTSSNAPYVGPSSPETTGSVAHTWTDYVHAGGTQNADIAANHTVGIVCRTIGFKVSDGNTWWYRVASGPWNGHYYVSADAFYNNGATSGSLHGTPFVDSAVPLCDGSAGSAPTPVTPPSTPTPTQGSTWTETPGSIAHTWTNYSNAGGTQGPSLSSGQAVQIACVVQGFRVADGNTNWYEIASGPWNNQYYVSADAFYNNGATSGSLKGTPWVDPAVPACSPGDGGGGTPTTWAETTGSVAHTWTNYSNAGGTQGPEIANNQTIQIACVVQGFRVADGNTNWYRIAASPWNNQFYVSADAFYNNGATSGPLHGTPWVDPAVATC